MLKKVFIILVTLSFGGILVQSSYGKEYPTQGRVRLFSVGSGCFQGGCGLVAISSGLPAEPAPVPIFRAIFLETESEAS